MEKLIICYGKATDNEDYLKIAWRCTARVYTSLETDDKQSSAADGTVSIIYDMYCSDLKSVIPPLLTVSS